MAAVIGEAQPAVPVGHATGLGAAPLRLRSARTRVLLVVDALAAVVGTLAVQSNLIEAKPILLVAVAACWLGCLGLMRSYEPRLLRPWTEEVHRVVEAGLILTVIAVGMAAWWDLELYSSNFLVLSGVTVAISLAPTDGDPGLASLAPRTPHDATLPRGRDGPSGRRRAAGPRVDTGPRTTASRSWSPTSRRSATPYGTTVRPP